MPNPFVVLATAGYDHTIRFWEATRGVCYRTLQHQDSQVNKLEISPDKQILAAAGNPTIKIFEVNASNPSPPPPEAPPSPSPPPPEQQPCPTGAMPNCCMAMTASCLACKECTTVDEWCAANPSTEWPGCESAVEAPTAGPATEEPATVDETVEEEERATATAAAARACRAGRAARA